MAGTPVNLLDLSSSALLTSLNDDDIVYVVRPVGTTKDYVCTVATLKSKVKSETSISVTATGSLPANVDIILLNVGGSTINLILPDGINNQEVLIIGNSMSSNAIITPSHFTNSTITFTLTGQTIKLKFIINKWFIISNNGTTIS